jgi:hypothetical protein
VSVARRGRAAAKPPLETLSFLTAAPKLAAASTRDEKTATMGLLLSLLLLLTTTTTVVMKMELFVHSLYLAVRPH